MIKKKNNLAAIKLISMGIMMKRVDKSQINRSLFKLSYKIVHTNTHKTTH